MFVQVGALAPVAIAPSSVGRHASVLELCYEDEPAPEAVPEPHRGEDSALGHPSEGEQAWRPLQSPFSR